MTDNELLTAHETIMIIIIKAVGDVNSFVTRAEADRRDEIEAELTRRNLPIRDY